MDIPRLKFWRYAKSLDNMSAGDRLFSIVVEKIRFTIFTSFISDISLFSLNELAHYDMRVDQDNHGGMSYAITLFCFILGVYDMIRMFRINQDYILLKKKMSPRLSLDPDESAINLNESAQEEKRNRADNLSDNGSHGSNDNLIARQRVGTAIPIRPDREEEEKNENREC